MPGVNGGHTLAQRHGDIRMLANAYNVPIKLSKGEIDQCAELGKYDVFALLNADPEYKHYFLDTTKTFSHGDDFPADFLVLGGHRWIDDGSGGELPVRYAPVQDLATLTRNGRLAGSATQPVLYLSDNKFKFLPSSVTGAHIDVYLHPAPCVNDSDTDTMPEFSEPDIARSGFEFMLKMMVDQQTALELNKQELERVESAIMTLYRENFAFLNKDLMFNEA